MKTIALIGATGQVGQKFLEQALAKGYKIKALVRNPDKVKQKNANLELIKGDVLNHKDVNKTVEETDIVVSLFGHVKGSPKWLQTEGTKNIIDAMRNHLVFRIISLSGGGLPFPEKDKPKFADKIIRTVMKITVPTLLNDAKKHYEILKASGLKWTIVRAPILTNDEKKREYRVGWVGVNASTKISRADLADFIVNQVEDETFNHQMPFISY
jgi:putative NADH-flavin reductase